MEFIDLKEQYCRYKHEIDAAISRVLHHGQFIMGPEVAELESKLATFVGVKHCLSVSSGTDSLEIAFRALGIGLGDEVITVPFTWISSAEAVALVGAKPVFVDINISDFNIDCEKIEAAITPRTKAIQPVSLFGQMPNFARINEMATSYGLTVIEDAAQSLGSTQNGIKSCGISMVGSTSFFPAKPLGCFGDGGALFTNDEDLAAKMRAIRTHGGVKRHFHPFLGMNGRFDTIQAAILLAKLPHFEAEIAARERVARRYNELLGGFCEVPVTMPGNSHVFAQYTIRVRNRDSLGALLASEGIPSAIYYPKCLHEQPVFGNLGYKLGDFPEAERASKEVISLPMHPFLTEFEQDVVVAAVLKYAEPLENANRR